MEGTPRLTRLLESEDADQTEAPSEQIEEPADEEVPEALPFSESVATDGSMVLREARGNVFEVLVIQPGTSKNRRRYRRPVLEAATPLFEGARAFASDGPDHDPRKRGVKALVGWHSQPRYDRGVELPNGTRAEGVVTHFHVTDSGLAETLRESISGGKPDLITFSIVGDGAVNRVTEARKHIDDVVRIDAIESVDPVIHAAAGGMAVRLVASTEVPMDWDTLTLAEAIKALAAGEATADDIKEHRPDFYEAIEAGQVTIAEQEAAEEAEAEPAEQETEDVPEPVIESVEDVEGESPESVDRLVEAALEARLAPITTRERVEDALAAHPNLPQRVRDRVRKTADERARAERKALSEADVDAIVKDEAEYLAALNPAAVKDAGKAEVTDMKSERERVTEALYEIMAGKSNDSVKALYIDLTGDRSLQGKLAEGGRLTESIASTTFAEILGDSVTRRMLDLYNLPELNAWRNIASVVPVGDFRTQHRTRMGGYGNLPGVNQGAAYGALTSPGDEESTYAPTKRGGTEDITLETIANDDLGAIRQVPVRLGRAAAQTLHEFVFDFLADNPTIYDSNSLFDAGNHANTATDALADASLVAGRTAMRKQTDMSSSKRLAINPRFLVVPIDLEQTAYELTQTDREVGSAYNTLNFVRTFGLGVIVVDYWTDANNWYLVADPAMQPTIEVGFLNGREEPELFLQDTPNVGSVFSNDKLTYKIRHIYGGAVMDYRPFYGGIVA